MVLITRQDVDVVEHITVLGEGVPVIIARHEEFGYQLLVEEDGAWMPIWCAETEAEARTIATFLSEASVEWHERFTDIVRAYDEALIGN